MVEQTSQMSYKSLSSWAHGELSMRAINSCPQKASPALPIIYILTLPLPLPLPFFFGFWHSCSLVFFSSSNS